MKNSTFKVLITVHPGPDGTCGDCSAVDYGQVPSCGIPWGRDDEPIPLTRREEQDPDNDDFGKTILERCQQCFDAEAKWRKQHTRGPKKMYLCFETPQQGGVSYVADVTATLAQIVQEIDAAKIAPFAPQISMSDWTICSWSTYDRYRGETKVGKITTKDMTKPLSALDFNKTFDAAEVTLQLCPRKSKKPT